MIWELGLGCFLPIRRRGSRSKDKKQGGKDNGDSDNDEAWLLVESGSLGPHFMSAVDPKSLAADPQSVHSSFRFSFGSQMDLEALNGSSSVSAATVLMVNLSTDLSDSQSHDMKWRRFQSLERSISPVASTLERFSYSEIRAATGNFSKDRVLGRGALSCVFKGRVGFLRKAVAIKRLVKEDKESTKAFCRELMIASSLHNRNVVLLMGFCIDPEEGLFLVYKFVSGGSLQHYLHANRGVKGGSLPWSVRFKVAVGIAEAIAYLHNGSEKCVVHRDIKPSNILLSSKKKPKLCDFGLATWTPAPSVPFLCKTVKGTFGYLAPEYFQHGKVSDKTDVYAFGVVLLELITGRKPIEANRRSGDDNLVLWAKALLQRGGSIKELLDPTLTISPRDSNQLMKMIQAAGACIESEESRRPSINQIVAILQGDENYSSSSNISAPSRNDSIIDNYSHLQHKKSEMRSHFALAMLGVSDYEEDNHLYCR
ncbi:probable serine/threonine-protein kinase PBL23 [Macadamia integrifolia]|uniref:probable serine/threonine-protein kinase PBL23 n=1 Tax=Macadamia integrifolia TaxID=60698 RepID=UPI001C4E573F|nr:probable serine/threonine-protein kinase PBL23 [Macadamia integrifolia]